MTFVSRVEVDGLTERLVNDLYEHRSIIAMTAPDQECGSVFIESHMAGGGFWLPPEDCVLLAEMLMRAVARCREGNIVAIGDVRNQRAGK